MSRSQAHAVRDANAGRSAVSPLQGACVWHDHQRAWRMVGALLSDGSEEQAAKPAESARSDDKEVRVLRLVEQHAGGCTRSHRGLDLDTGRQITGVVERLLERPARLDLELADESWVRSRESGAGHGRRDVPGRHGAYARAAQARLRERERERRARAVGAVHSDDDPAHARPQASAPAMSRLEITPAG